MQLSAAFGKRWDESLAPAKRGLIAKGAQVYVLPEAEVDTWIKASSNVVNEWIGDTEKRNLPAKQMLQDATDLLKKYK